MKRHYKIILGLLFTITYLWYIWPEKATQNLELLDNPQVFNQSELEELSENSIVEEQDIKIIVIDLKGAITNPGIYKMNENERIYQLIEKAGGFKNANIDCVNQALTLKDESQIIIPYSDESCDNNHSFSETDTNKININSASINEFTTLPGIGSTRARQIIEYRDAKNGFNSIEELKEVNGIGEQTFLNIQELITI